MTTTVTLRQLGPIDIQADPAYNQQKLSALIQQLQLIESSVNQLVQAVNALQSAETDTVPPHELAGTDGLGPSHTVSGLTAGQVLLAVSATVAEFAQLKLSQLADMSNSVFAPSNGDVLTWQDGYYQMKPPPTGETSESYVTANNEVPNLPNSRQLTGGSGITLDYSRAGKLIINGTNADGPLGFVLTGSGNGTGASFLFPQDAYYNTFAGAA